MYSCTVNVYTVDSKLKMLSELWIDIWMSLHDISLFCLLLTFSLQCWPLSWVWSGKTWKPCLWTPRWPRKRKCSWTTRPSVRCCTSVSSCFCNPCTWWRLYGGEVSSAIISTAAGWQLSSLLTAPVCECDSFYRDCIDVNRFDHTVWWHIAWHYLFIADYDCFCLQLECSLHKMQDCHRYQGCTEVQTKCCYT